MLNECWMLVIKIFFLIDPWMDAQGLCILALWTGRQGGQGIIDFLWIQCVDVKSDESRLQRTRMKHLAMQRWRPRSQLVELPSSKPLCLCVWRAKLWGHVSIHIFHSMECWLTISTILKWIRTHLSAEVAILSRRKSSCTWKMPKTCFAHHIQAQFGQMSGAFAVSSLLTASVPWLLPCNHARIMGEANWSKFVQAQFGRVLRFSCQPQCHCGCIFGWRSTERTPENLDIDMVFVWQHHRLYQVAAYMSKFRSTVCLSERIHTKSLCPDTISQGSETRKSTCCPGKNVRSTSQGPFETRGGLLSTYLYQRLSWTSYFVDLWVQKYFCQKNVTCKKGSGCKLANDLA